MIQATSASMATETKRMTAVFSAAAAAKVPGASPLVAARLIVEAALARRESRGGHWRADFPAAAREARHTRLRARTPAMAE